MQAGHTPGRGQQTHLQPVLDKRAGEPVEPVRVRLIKRG